MGKNQKTLGGKEIATWVLAALILVAGGYGAHRRNRQFEKKGDLEPTAVKKVNDQKVIASVPFEYDEDLNSTKTQENPGKLWKQVFSFAYESNDENVRIQERGALAGILGKVESTDFGKEMLQKFKEQGVRVYIGFDPKVSEALKYEASSKGYGIIRINAAEVPYILEPNSNEEELMASYVCSMLKKGERKTNHQNCESFLNPEERLTIAVLQAVEERMVVKKCMEQLMGQEFPNVDVFNLENYTGFFKAVRRYEEPASSLDVNFKETVKEYAENLHLSKEEQNIVREKGKELAGKWIVTGESETGKNEKVYSIHPTIKGNEEGDDPVSEALATTVSIKVQENGDTVVTTNMPTAKLASLATNLGDKPMNFTYYYQLIAVYNRDGLRSFERRGIDSDGRTVIETYPAKQETKSAPAKVSEQSTTSRKVNTHN